MVLAFLACVVGADAHGAFRGTVLAVQASKGVAIVERDKTAKEPGVTAAYRIDADSLAKIHAGDRIAATEDESAKPATLRDVLVDAASAAPPSAVREVSQLAIGDKVPQTTLMDENGKPFTLARYLGKNLVVGFIYTRCRDARECPLTTAKFGQLQTLFAKRDVGLLEVTLDPQFDTPPVLKKYGATFGADPTRWTFATGAPNDVLNVDAAFGLDPFADPTLGLIHSETLAVVDKTGTIRDLIYTGSWSPNEIVSELDGLDGVATNPFETLDLWLKRAAVSMCGDSVSGFDGILDQLVVIAIFAAAGYLLWRVYRAFGRAIG